MTQVDAYLKKGNVLLQQTRLGEAIENYELALQMQPRSAEILYNLGRALSLQGRMEESELYFRKALLSEPDNLIIYQAILMKMAYNPRYGTQTIFAEHQRLGRMLTEPFASTFSPFQNERSLSRRLRIGYVSPDFRRHSVAYFVEPVLSAHDHEEFEIFCYSDVSSPDEITANIQGHTDHWRTILNKSDEEVAEFIRSDKIDILVDLAGHTGPRMLLFANKSAPIQVTWIGYPSTTGLTTMDYKIVDHYTDPPGMTENYYCETLIRLPQSFLCYLPERVSPDTGKLPALEKGYVTFGSFNNIPKISSEMFSLWSNIVRSVPDAHLIMKAGSFSDSETRQLIVDIFAREGVQESRVELMPWIPSKREHLNAYNQVDIAFDTFPYNGTTTMCEAMWMGVPVITLAGTAHNSRVGISLLSNAGVPELIAKTREEYLEIAVELASDLNRLERYRKSMRAMMEDSPLTNARHFTRDLEERYRNMWETWCKSA